MSLLPTTKAEELPAGTTCDGFLGGRLQILQPSKGHRAGSDAVLLQAAIPKTARGKALDAGAGVGVASLCLAARAPRLHVTAVEIDASLCALAERNAAANGLAKRVAIVNADVTASRLAAKGIEPDSYDDVLANPPYHASGKVCAAPDDGKVLAHVMPEGALLAWVKFLARVTAPKGRLTLIHVPQSLPELLPAIEKRFGDIVLYPLFPRAGEAAHRIILQARKGNRRGLRFLPGLVLHNADGTYTPEAEGALREGKRLNLTTE